MKLPDACFRKNGSIHCLVGNRAIHMKSCEWQLGSGSSCTGKDGVDYVFPDAIFKPDFDKRVNPKSYGIIGFVEEHKPRRISSYEKELYAAGKLSDLGETGDKSIIESLYARGMGPVRKIKVEKDHIIIDACDGESPLKFPKDLDVYYEPWFLDRGSFVFSNPAGNKYPKGMLLKLATEGDIMREE